MCRWLTRFGQLCLYWASSKTPVAAPLVFLQETRIAKLLVSLKGRLSPYMAGEEDAFREVQVSRQLSLCSSILDSLDDHAMVGTDFLWAGKFLWQLFMQVSCTVKMGVHVWLPSATPGGAGRSHSFSSHTSCVYDLC